MAVLSQVLRNSRDIEKEKEQKRLEEEKRRIEEEKEKERQRRIQDQQESEYKFMTDPRLMQNELEKYQRYGRDGAELMSKNNNSIKKINKLIKKCNKTKSSDPIYESFTS